MNDIHDRLRQARLSAGFSSAAAAARHFGWPGSTYGGHENGQRGIKQPDVAKYAEAFDVTPEWLFSGRRDAQVRATPAQPVSGLSEASVAPFSGRSDSERRAILAMAETARIAPRHPSLHRITRHIPGLLLKQGDVLVVDLKPTPRDGQIVMVQVTDPDSGEAATELAVMQAGQLRPAYGESALDGEATVLGAIVLTIRLDG